MTSCPSRRGGRRCTRPPGHTGLHRHQGTMWNDDGADPLHCPASGGAVAPAALLRDGFPGGRALCPHCSRFIRLEGGRLVDHDTSDPDETESEAAHAREWMNTHGW